jgi:TRAP-type C4-dicarboxylate transport system permease small subunit
MSASPDDKQSLPTDRNRPAEADIFIEDVEASFDWKSIPLEGWLCIPIFWVLAAVVFWQFFTRYALDNSAVWTEEVARQLLILLTFFGAAFGLRTRAHICIAYFADKLPGRLRRRVDEVSALLQFAFYGYGTVLALKVAAATKFQQLMSVDISKSVVYYAVAAAFALLTLRAGLDAWRLCTGAPGQGLSAKACSSGESGR